MNKVVVVTGGASGIGEAIAIRAARDGGRIVIIDVRDADRTIERIRSADGEAAAYQCDLRDSSSVVEVFSEIEKAYGTVDILINNAGTMGHWPATVSEFTDEDWNHIFETNVKSAFLCCRAVLPSMRKKGMGKIVNMGSELAIVAAEGCSLYCASKAAIVHFTRALAVDEARHGILVNCVCPGPVDTALLYPTAGDERSVSDLRRASIESTLIGRLGTPNEIAELTWFVASAGIGFMVGSAILADGGVTAR